MKHRYDTHPHLQLPAILISCSPSCRWVERRVGNRCTGAATQVSVSLPFPSEAFHPSPLDSEYPFFLSHSPSIVPSLTRATTSVPFEKHGCGVTKACVVVLVCCRHACTANMASFCLYFYHIFLRSFMFWMIIINSVCIHQRLCSPITFSLHFITT